MVLVGGGGNDRGNDKGSDGGNDRGSEIWDWRCNSNSWRRGSEKAEGGSAFCAVVSLMRRVFCGCRPGRGVPGRAAWPRRGVVLHWCGRSGLGNCPQSSRATECLA